MHMRRLSGYAMKNYDWYREGRGGLEEGKRRGGEGRGVEGEGEGGGGGVVVGEVAHQTR